MDISFSPKCVLSNTYKILELYLIIYTEHKITIEFWSNGLTLGMKKIESWAHN